MDLEHVPEELKIAFVRMLGDKSLSPKTDYLLFNLSTLVIIKTRSWVY